MTSRTILSGIRPSSRLHVGNYLGAIQQWLELQHRARCFFMIADLHAITTPYEPKALPAAIRDVALDYLAAGLDRHKATLFVQSHVPEHVELAWLFSTLVPVGELNRMTQYKEKGDTKERATLGLFAYPVLMAADILVYRAEQVPVGDDQVQHVELARVIARKFNHRFGQVFPEPKPILSTGRRVMSLQDPKKKMSKSDGGGIQLDDDPGAIRKKLAKAVTGTKGGDGNPGAMNLLMLLKEFGDPAGAKRFLADEEAGTIKYSELKNTLAEAIDRHFANFRTKRRDLAANPSYLDEILADGAARARHVAAQTLRDAKRAMGLIN